MSKLTPLTQSQRVAQALEIMRLIAGGMSQREACERVGMSPDTFRRWIASDEDAIRAMKDLIMQAERQQLLDLEEIRREAMRRLRDAVQSPEIEPNEVLAILKYVDQRASEISDQHTEPTEDAAYEFLQGPTLKKAISRMTTINVAPRGDGSADITVISPPEVVDGEITDVPSS